MNIANLLARAGRVHADRPAIVFGRTVLSNYRDLAGRAAAIAGGLMERVGLVPGDRVAIVMSNCPAYIEALFACWWGGFVAVPVNAKLHPREFAYILNHAGVRACFVAADTTETIAALRPELAALAPVIPTDGDDYRRLAAAEPIAMTSTAPDDVAWLFYTSGTTGFPKGAMLSHRNLMAMTTSYFIDVDSIVADDCILHPAPLSHGSGLYILPHVAVGAKQVIPESGGFDPAEVLDLIAAFPGAAFFGAPTLVRRLVEAAAASGADTRNLKTIVYGGAPMYVEDCKRALAVLGQKLVQIYGQGESPMTITALGRAWHAASDDPRYEARLASVGVAHTVVEVTVADIEDRPLPAGEIGEVLVRGDSVMRGYWRDPGATASTLRGGWLHTGDVGVLDDGGFLTLKDRSKDLIISGGFNIYPREVEEVLLREPSVAEVSVVGQADREWGEVVIAFVVPAADAPIDPEVLDALCLAHLARFKRPKRYVVVSALPKNNYGKVLKRELRQRLAQQSE